MPRRSKEQLRKEAELLKEARLFEIMKGLDIFKTFQCKYPHCTEVMTADQEIAEDGSKLLVVTLQGNKPNHVIEELSITINWESEQIVKTELKEDRFVPEFGYYWSELSDLEKAVLKNLEKEKSGRGKKVPADKYQEYYRGELPN